VKTIVLSQFHLPLIIITHLLKIHLDVILPVPFRSPKNRFPRGPSIKFLYVFIVQRILLHATLLSTVGDLYTSRSSSLCNILNCSRTSSFLLIILKHLQFMFFSQNMGVGLSFAPHKMVGKIIFYNLNFCTVKNR